MVTLPIGITMARSVTMTICRAVMDTVGGDHFTLTRIVSPTVSGMMARVVQR
jgi:hypothetical protein